MPWRSTISVPRERLTLAAQFEKLAAVSQRAAPNGDRLAKMQAEAMTTLETATFAFDRVLEELASLDLATPNLKVYARPAKPSVSGATLPVAADVVRVKRAA